VDSTAVVGSAVHISIRPVNNVSRGMINGRKPGRPSRKSIIRIQSNGESAVGINWWRGGRLSREVFHWKMLPRTLASKTARQGLQYLFQMVCTASTYFLQKKAMNFVINRNLAILTKCTFVLEV
jgi:hypothetical protein